MDLSGWVLTIVGVAFLTVVVDILLPSGETNRYVKSIFALITVYLMASGLAQCLTQSDFTFASREYYDPALFEYVTQQRQDEYVRKLQERLEQNGCEATLTCEFDETASVPVPLRVRCVLHLGLASVAERTLREATGVDTEIFVEEEEYGTNANEKEKRVLSRAEGKGIASGSCRCDVRRAFCGVLFRRNGKNDDGNAIAGGLHSCDGVEIGKTPRDRGRSGKGARDDHV